MLFSSIPFLYYFLPAVLICYFLAPKRFKTTVILLSSLIFYAWGEPRYVLIMVAEIISGYIFGILIEKAGETFKAKVFTALSVFVSLGLLAYFKYADFFLESFSRVTGISVPALKISLPIGISFYTFQMLSYTIDVSRKKVRAQRNILKLGAYISMFPQLIAGPIVRYSDIERQLSDREHTFSGAALGIRRFLIGLGKKTLIANALGELCGHFLSTAQPSVLYGWVYALGFALQIYYDFSGYSDMAIGLGHIFGFTFPENFNYPFISGSITEFWRRWHMTLGGWFRDYLYIPLGGNRVSKVRWILNIFIVWFATGLWHGAAWNFVVWGLYFGILLMIEKLWLIERLEKTSVIKYIYTAFFLLISFVIFNGESMEQALGHLGVMFGAGSVPLISAEGLFYLRNYAVIIIFALIGATPIVKNSLKVIYSRPAGKKTLDILEIPVLLALLIAVNACLVNGSFNPFLYFRF